MVNIGQDAPSIDAGVTTIELTFPCHVLCRELQRHNTENLANIEAVAGKDSSTWGSRSRFAMAPALPYEPSP